MTSLLRRNALRLFPLLVPLFMVLYSPVADARLSMIAGGRVAAIRAGQRSAARRGGEHRGYRCSAVRSAEARRIRNLGGSYESSRCPNRNPYGEKAPTVYREPRLATVREHEEQALAGNEDKIGLLLQKKGGEKKSGWGCFLCGGGKNMPVEDED